MRYLKWIFPIFVFVLLAEDTDLYAQWKKIKSSVVTPYSSLFANNEYGAIHFKDGILWAGWHSAGTALLQFSLDSGMTWKQSNLDVTGGIITDINFFDKLTGLVATLNEGIFHTTDGGETWVQILAVSGCTNIVFNNSPRIIHALTSGDFPSPTGLLHTSTDGGLTWSATSPGGEFCSCFTISKTGTIYTLCCGNASNGLPGFVSSSTDLGKTWKALPAEVDGDSYTICSDSSDQNRLFIANEDYTDSPNNFSDLYYSNDGGNSWISSIQFTIPYLSGGMTCTRNAIYASSLKKGIYRSTDNGKNWKNTSASIDTIGSAFDTHNIACANDNIVFVLDSAGNIWETTNGGGDSVVGKSSVTPASISYQTSSYPNPSNGQVRIEYKLPEGVATGEIIITNIEGVEVKRYKVGNIFSDILIEKSDLPSGSYFYKLVTAKGESEARKLVVLR